MIANNIFGLIAKLFIFFKRFIENKKDQNYFCGKYKEQNVWINLC